MRRQEDTVRIHTTSFHTADKAYEHYLKHKTMPPQIAGPEFENKEYILLRKEHFEKLTNIELKSRKTVIT